MKFRELINTNSNILNGIYVYYLDTDWEEGYPTIQVSDVRELEDSVLNSYVDQWEVDIRSNLHVLLSE